jgi:hypothetical protein
LARLSTLWLWGAVVCLLSPEAWPQSPAEELSRAQRELPGLSRSGLEPDAISAGRVVAVDGQRAELMTAANLHDRLLSGGVFVRSGARAGIAKSAMPHVLRAQTTAPESAFRLSFDVVVVDAGRNLTQRLDTWVRDSTGLLMDGRRSAFVGTFDVALTDASNEDNRGPLGHSVVVAIKAPGATELEPQPLTITQLGHWQSVSIIVPDVPGDTYAVSVSADPRRDGDPVPLAIMRPSVRLWASPDSIVGWGIGQSNINVSVTGMRAPEGYRVPLRSGRGSLNQDFVTLNAHGQGSVRLRSDRSSGATIELLSPAMAGQPLQVRFDAPWLFLAIAICGGLVGAFLRGRGRQHWGMALLIGALSAVVMTAAYAVGLDWPARVLKAEGLAVAGEALIFVLGAVGALVGVSAMVPGVKPPEPAEE